MLNTPEERTQVQTLEGLKSELAQLTEQNRSLLNILLNLPENFYCLNLEGRVILCNERQAAYFGMNREDFLGLNIFDLAKRFGWSEEVAQQIRQNDLKVMASGQRMIHEEQVDYDGELKTFLSYKYPLYDANDALMGIFGLSIDITDRKKMELALLEEKQRAEAANTAKTNFLMNISHDIRTPFSGIIGNSEILLKQETSEEKRMMLQEILASSHYLLELLDDIIDVVKLEEKHKSEPLTFDLIQSIQKMALMMNLEAKQKHINFALSIAEDVPQYVLSDRKSIERILLNLLGNAIKFTHEGGVSLSVRSLSRDANRVRLEISVKDTGIGIPEAKINDIFDRFSRLSPQYDASFQGSGLGLWIVKGLVEQLGGEIEVKSQLNSGTEFRLILDLALSERTAASSPKKINASENTIQSILLIEDNPIAQKAAHYLLHDFFKAEVETVQSAKAALDSVSQKKYDLILMDIELPDMSGVDLARKIKEINKQQKIPPIIALSAHPEGKAELSIFDAALQKPLTYEACTKLAALINQ